MLNREILYSHNCVFIYFYPASTKDLRQLKREQIIKSESKIKIEIKNQDQGKHK